MTLIYLGILERRWESYLTDGDLLIGNVRWNSVIPLVDFAIGRQMLTWPTYQWTRTKNEKWAKCGLVRDREAGDKNGQTGKAEYLR